MRILIFLLLTQTFIQAAFGQSIWYVATTGTNATGSGTSISTPFKTVTYAVTKASHGDTIKVIGGTYSNTTYGTWNLYKAEQTVRINNKNSTSGNYLVIKPYNNVVVKFKGDGDYIFQIRNSSYIQAEGFEIEGELNNIPLDTALKYQFAYHDNTLNKDTFRVAFGTPKSVIDTMTFPVLTNSTRPSVFNNEGLTVQGSHHINIFRNKIYNAPAAGLRIAGSDYTNILENEIYNCTHRTSVGPPALVLSLINSIDNNNGTKMFIERNKVYNNYNEVYSWNGTKTFINTVIDEGKGISMEHCIKRTSPQPSWNFGRIRIQNNICYGNGLSGINTNEAERVDIINNTCYQNIASQTGSNTGISVNDANDVLVANNIVYSVNSFGGYALAARNPINVHVFNNLVIGAMDTDIAAIDTNTIFTNPLFTNATAFDFSLQATSPAINIALISVAPTTDFFNHTRDATPDLGAVEYISSVLPISLLDFYLDKLTNHSVQLFWTTVSETNNDYFIVEKSKDSIDWEFLAKIDGVGNATTSHDYTTIDNNPFIGSTYYRLKQVDANSSFSYSKIIAVNFSSTTPFKFYPNPTQQTVIFEKENINTVAVFSAIGANITSSTNIKIANYNATVDLSNLAAGVYFIKMDNDVFRIVKDNK